MYQQQLILLFPITYNIINPGTANKLLQLPVSPRHLIIVYVVKLIIEEQRRNEEPLSDHLLQQTECFILENPCTFTILQTERSFYSPDKDQRHQLFYKKTWIHKNVFLNMKFYTFRMSEKINETRIYFTHRIYNLRIEN